MQYPLIEKIGDPNLLVGREKEFQYFNKWVANIPKKLSKSRRRCCINQIKMEQEG